MKRLSYLERIPYCKHPLASELLQLMHDKETNLALSADVTIAKELIAIADYLGPEICVLKTHIDIVSDFSPALTVELQRLAEKHRFLLFEDRKFADIGHTVRLQYEAGVYHIADWAHFINAHSLPGPGIIEGLAAAGRHKGRALLLLAEMSSAANLIDKHYIEKTVNLAEAYQDFVIGFIAQRKLSANPGWLYLTPGVELTAKQDQLGQRYVTPEQVIQEHGSDIIIVGRGIVKSSDPLVTAKLYRERGWQAQAETV